MKKKEGVSRREFLKGVGGGAVGTAVIAAGLQNPISGVAFAAATPDKKIPDDITQRDLKTIQAQLTTILTELGPTGVEIVNMRLNETGKIDAAPVFVGWVESESVKNLRSRRRESNPESSRILDDVPGGEYKEALEAKGTIRDRDWPARLREKSKQQKAQVPGAGILYQRLIGIVVKNRCVGTLNIGFPVKPPNQAIQEADKVITRWAKDPTSKLVAFLGTNFQLGGPTL